MLFNPYDGAVLLMRERWSSVTAPFNRKRPELELLYIPHENNKNYKPVGTTLPTGMVLQESDIEFKDGQEVKGHAGSLIIESSKSALIFYPTFFW